MKKSILVLACNCCYGVFCSKKLTTTSGTISFDATTKLDALPKADNKTVVAALNTKTGEVAFGSSKSFFFANQKCRNILTVLSGWTLTNSPQQLLR